MKKFLAAAATALAGLFLFAGCSAQVTANISSGWLTSPANNYDSSFYESLDYSVRFANSETDEHLNIAVDEENSSLNMTTEAQREFSSPAASGLIYTNVYHTKFTLQVSATYTYTREGAEALEFSFGGENDTDPNNTDFAPEDADTLVLEAWFTSPETTITSAEGQLDAPPAFSPIYSTQTWRTHAGTTSVPQGGTTFVSMYDYSIKIAYDSACQNATITYTDNYADLTDEDRTANENVEKIALNFPESREIGNLQKKYTCIDNAQMYFIARGLAMNTETTHTLTVVSGVAYYYPSYMRISCTELVKSRFTFTMKESDGTETSFDNAELDVATMNFGLTETGHNTGEPTKVTYAQRPATGTNTNRCLPLRIELPYGWSVGNFVFTLQTADYAAPAQA